MKDLEVKEIVESTLENLYLDYNVNDTCLEISLKLHKQDWVHGIEIDSIQISLYDLQYDTSLDY